VEFGGSRGRWARTWAGELGDSGTAPMSVQTRWAGRGWKGGGRGLLGGGGEVQASWMGVVVVAPRAAGMGQGMLVGRRWGGRGECVAEGRAGL